MAEKTEYLGLTLPKSEDYYNIEVQNQNMEKLDAAISGAINVGAYIGDGSDERFIELPRTPKFVLVIREGSNLSFDDGYPYIFGGLAITDFPANSGEDYIIIEENGFRIKELPDGKPPYYSFYRVNLASMRYSYIWG